MKQETSTDLSAFSGFCPLVREQALLPGSKPLTGQLSFQDRSDLKRRTILIGPKLYSKEWWREYRKKNSERLRQYKRKYDSKRYKTHLRQELARRRRWADRNPEKIRAQQLVVAAVASGAIVRRPCSVCGAAKTHAHHEDYSRPLDVIWLCPAHHSAVTRAKQVKP